MSEAYIIGGVRTPIGRYGGALATVRPGDLAAHAAASAAAGTGLTRLYSYHVADLVRDGRLTIVLADAEHPPLPVHLIAPQGRMTVPKVRAFVDFAAPRLRSEFTRFATQAGALT